MDWTEERYVRLYTRDTGDMLAIGWQGRAVLAEYMRKADRAGILDETDPAILAEMFRMPIDVCCEGLDKLTRRGVVEAVKGAFVIPNFIEAQEAVQSDKQRQRESRARRRDLARGQTVTERDTPSRLVTTGHAESRAVTDGHSVPYRTVPYRADPPTPPGGDGGGSPRDQLVAWGRTFCRLTGRHDFDGEPESWGASATQYLRDMRSTCGTLDVFEARLSALMADRGDFYSRQSLRYWAETALNAPIKPPTASTPAAPYHRPIVVALPDDSESCTYAEAMADHGGKS